MTPTQTAIARVRIALAHGRALATDVWAWLKRVLGISADMIQGGKLQAAIATPAAHEGQLLARMLPRLTAAAKDTNREAFRPFASLKPAADAGSIVHRADDAISTYLRRYAVRRVKGITKTTAKKIRKVIADGKRDGHSLEQIAATMRKVSRSKHVQARAETIAQTEIHQATERAALIAAKKTGLKLIKVWASLEDERVRPAHAAADGQKRQLHEAFDVGGEKMMYPGDPNGSAHNTINCRCICVYSAAPLALGIPRQWRPVRSGVTVNA